MTEEKQVLQQGKSYVTVTGKLKLTENAFSGEKTSPSGYVYTRLNLGVQVAEGVTVYGEMMGGYTKSNPIIYSMNKEDNSALQVNFADRLNEAVVASTPDFKLHKVGLTRGDDGKLVVVNFLSPMDVHDYAKEHLVDGMDITLKGSFEFSEYKDETQRKFIIQNIFLPYQEKEKDADGKDTGNVLPVIGKASFVQTIVLTEDSFKKITKEEAQEGEVIVTAQAVQYISKKDKKPVKKNMPFPVAITVRINKENPAMTEKILKALFDVKKGKVRELTIEGDIIEGYDQQEVSGADVEISPEIQELIAMGLYTEEEAKSKMTVRGNKVNKLIFTRPFLKKDKEDPTKISIDLSDDKYTPEDLIVVIEEEGKNDTFSELVEGGTEEVSDTSWMDALGIG